MCSEPNGIRLLNSYNEITIKGTKYKIHSVFDGKKSFQSLMEDLIVLKASRPKKAEKNHDQHCEGNDIAV